MGARRIAAIALTGALVAGGAGAAIAAVTKHDGEKAEQEVLADAAKRLDVTPEKLRGALSAAQDAQLDEAVKEGDLTRKQADAIKAAREHSGRVLGPLVGPRLHHRFAPGGGGPGHRGLRLRHGLLQDAAKALGMTPAKLVESLRGGESLADIAKANGTSLAEVRATLKAKAKTRLDEAVDNGDLTQKQADAILDRVENRLKAIESGRPLRLRRHGHRGAPPPAALRPGGLLPGAGPPDLVPPGAYR